MHEARLAIEALVFPGFTLLDLVGPLEILHRLPGAEVTLVGSAFRCGESAGGIRAEGGFELRADRGLGWPRPAPEAPLDVLLIPGGPGQRELMEDDEVLKYLTARAERARLVVSVCTGSLVLAAAGLLDGRRATTHWSCLELLAELGARPLARRVVRDGKFFSGAGVAAGLDLALVVAAELAGEEEARRIQLTIEYDPDPPFASGSPRRAAPALLDRMVAERAEVHAARLEQARRIARKRGLVAHPPHSPETHVMER